ncbi:MAG TPA: polysaccharide biosynthesis/export family protein [Blastocatellia bacterium]|nr:polysaccharide biosynthesis/export family protein [Blastocatellia bacterium]
MTVLVLLPVVNVFPRQDETPSRNARPRTASYQLHKGDKVSVKFLYQPELNEPSVVVRPDGYISLQMVSDIKAEGLTIPELKKAIEEAYSEQLLKPEISVSLVEFVAPHVFVGGQVQKPGSYELRSAQTVLQAVIVAGGFTKEAHRKMVLHARPTGVKELKVTVVDLQQLLAGRGTGEESQLQDGDYVFVPDSKLSKFNQVVEAFRFAVPGFTLR